MTICVVPLVPSAATLDSFVAAIHHLNVHSSNRYTLRLLSGKQTGLAKDIFGQAARSCAQNISSGPFSSENRILENHTLWPFCAYTLPTPLMEEWRKVQLSTVKCPWRGFLYGRSPSQFAKTDRSACIDCLKEDLDRYGLAYLRTYHQIRGISHCIQHLTPLISTCQSCGANIRPKCTSLPGLLCSGCGAQLSTPRPRRLPASYWKMLEIMRFLFDGNWKILSPEIRRPYYEKALINLRLFPINARSARQIIARITKRWHARSLASISRLLAFPIDVKSISSALAGTDSGCAPLLHLLLLEHFHSTQRKLINLFSISELEHAATQYEPPEAPGPYALPLDKQHALLRALDRSGLPRSVLYELALGVSWKQLCRRYFLGSARTQQLDTLVPWFPPYRRVIAADKWATAHSNVLESRSDFSRRLREYRQIALKYSAAGRPGWQKFYQQNRSAYSSLRRNDRAFFDEIRTRIQLRTERCAPDCKDQLEPYKLRVLHAINSPCKPTRTQIWRMEKQAMLILTKNCYDWLQKTLPPALQTAAACQHYSRYRGR
jgi:hypothetical protein